MTRRCPSADDVEGVGVITPSGDRVNRRNQWATTWSVMDACGHTDRCISVCRKTSNHHPPGAPAAMASLKCTHCSRMVGRNEATWLHFADSCVGSPCAPKEVHRHNWRTAAVESSLSSSPWRSACSCGCLLCSAFCLRCDGGDGGHGRSSACLIAGGPIHSRATRGYSDRRLPFQYSCYGKVSLSCKR